MKSLRVLKLHSHLAHTELHCYVMDKTTSYNKTQKGELSESCQEIDVDHILNATESLVGREERKGNWENCISSTKKNKKQTNKKIKLSSKRHISRCSLSVEITQSMNVLSLIANIT